MPMSLYHTWVCPVTYLAILASEEQQSIELIDAKHHGGGEHAAQTASKRQAYVTSQQRVLMNAKEWQMKPLGGERIKITADEHLNHRESCGRLKPPRGEI